MEDLYYSDYIELDKILNSQHPKSFSSLEDGNDEMLFIVIHQAYELWFKQILFELDLVRNIFIRDRINDNADDMSSRRAAVEADCKNPGTDQSAGQRTGDHDRPRLFGIQKFPFACLRFSEQTIPVDRSKARFEDGATL